MTMVCTIAPGWACSTAVSAGDSSSKVPSRGNARSGRDEFRETFGRLPSHGNPEPSRRCTGGRCRDYLRAESVLNDRRRASRTHTHGQCAGEEIVHSRRKRRGQVNPLVVGSNPTGPRLTNSAPQQRSRVAAALREAAARCPLPAGIPVGPPVA